MESQPNPEQHKELGGEIAAVLQAVGESAGFDPETCDEIAEMPFDEAFEIAYGYLAQAGLDPDAILAQFME
jgi:hypothetical protein